MLSKIARTSRIFCGVALIVLGASQNFPAFPFPSQSATDLDGKAADPFKASQGKITVLIFVRTDCPISNRYAPLLRQLSETYGGNAKFWLIYPDKKTTAQEIREHLAQYNYKISALRDSERVLVKRANATITPEAAVFDPQGRLLYHGRIDNWYEDAGRARPAATTHELQSAVEAAISGKPVPLASANAVGCYISDLE
ncbi:MAG TPA: thioredoxin-like domain-containing protein [Candidatus Sulfotelmatobacter sp.]|jgi:thiol-disulfide isomerase/thioredoxin|nr:thioredoxin-like domain-containing protein [Candidatus Sulfotelmatobacter sp.]